MTDPKKNYVLTNGHFYLKRDGLIGEQRWRKNIGSIEHGATQFKGGPALDNVVTLNFHAGITAVEDKRKVKPK